MREDFKAAFPAHPHPAALVFSEQSHHVQGMGFPCKPFLWDSDQWGKPPRLILG